MRDHIQEILSTSPNNQNEDHLNDWGHLSYEVGEWIRERKRRQEEGRHRYLVVPLRDKDGCRRWAYTLEEARQLARQWETWGWEPPVQIIYLDYRKGGLKRVELVIPEKVS